VKKVVFIDDREFEINEMRKIFESPDLSTIYSFEGKHYPLNLGSGEITRDKQIEKILRYLQSEWDNIAILLMDMDLIDNPSDKNPISLQIIDDLLMSTTYKLRFDTMDIIIIFVTGYSEKKSNLTDNELWRKEFICRDKPKFSSLTARVPLGCCPKAQESNCKKGQFCLRTDCFKEFFLMLERKELNNE
jgi:hypothetical protein